MMIGKVIRTGQINRQKAFSTNKPEVIDLSTTGGLYCADCGAALREGTEFCTPCEAARKVLVSTSPATPVAARLVSNLVEREHEAAITTPQVRDTKSEICE